VKRNARRKRKLQLRRGLDDTSAHTRRARAALARGEVAEIDVDDPYATRTGEKIRVLRSLRSDPLARLHNRKQIDEAQYRAGRAFQRDCEAAARGVRSLDLSRERVDGGAPGEPITDLQVRARKRLMEMERVLGRTMHRVTQAVLVDGMSMESIAQRIFNREGEVSVKYYGRLFRDALDVLAEEYDLAGRRTKVGPRPYPVEA
jgi:hypothetical protein